MKMSPKAAPPTTATTTSDSTDGVSQGLTFPPTGVENRNSTAAAPNMKSPNKKFFMKRFRQMTSADDLYGNWSNARERLSSNQSDFMPDEGVA